MNGVQLFEDEQVKARVTLHSLAVALTLGCGEAAVPDIPPAPRAVLSDPDPSPGYLRLQAATWLTPARRALLDELSEARARWRRAGPDEYRLTVAFGNGSFEFRVRGKSATDASGVRRSLSFGPESLRTVELMFAEAERLIRSDVDEVTVLFEPRLGYPSRVSADWERMRADDELVWTAALTAVE